MAHDLRMRGGLLDMFHALPHELPSLYDGEAGGDSGLLRASRSLVFPLRFIVSRKPQLLPGSHYLLFHDLGVSAKVAPELLVRLLQPFHES